ncbi:uncharacterized protein LOC125216510 isoform X1 [Salvia hispanica]|uniref:uncharacterized protein LOC125216510 isoform X1 n=1 Tax=Salvia hispanica TaxID=49212 RepID=UPI0020098094|nr:uncharacterized protein LOC125216510 isoform X1 [Salvia hispanica]
MNSNKNYPAKSGSGCIIESAMDDLDLDAASWVLDFLLRKPLEERTLNSLLGALPLPKDNPKLQKIILLKKLEFELSPPSFSEATLDLLEQLDGIECRRGNEASNALKSAYCSVAVDITLRPLKHGDDSKFILFETVKRVWRGRIGKIEKSAQRGGLGSEQLWVWKDEIEVAVWEDSVCQSVFKKFDRDSAEKAVRFYLNEERDKMGPSFLESVAAGLKSGEGLFKFKRIEVIKRVAEEEALSLSVVRAANGSNGSVVIKPVAEEETLSPCVDRAANGSNGSKEMHKGKIKLKDKLVGVRRVRSTAGNSRGAKIVDCDEADEAEPSGKIHRRSPRSAETNEAWEALKKSSKELRASVKDPLPDALRLADAIHDGLRQDKRQEVAENSNVEPRRQDECQDRAGTSNDGPKIPVTDGDRVVQSSVANANNVHRSSLMKRNGTARTSEWDDSNDGSPIDTVLKPSPLRQYDGKRRRRARKWSLDEEETLRIGVERFGKGCWKRILDEYRDAFDGRTDVDLKDKWRNMCK